MHFAEFKNNDGKKYLLKIYFFSKSAVKICRDLLRQEPLVAACKT